MARREQHAETARVEKTSNVIRKFGRNECYQAAFHALDMYRGTFVSCRYVIPPKLNSSTGRASLMQSVNTAIIDVVMKHSLLHVGIQGAESRRPAWIQLDNFDPHQHIEWRDMDDLEHFERSLQGVQEAQLDMRALVLCPQGADCLEILFAYNHANVDGWSGKIFHEDLLQRFNAARTGQAHEQAQSLSGALNKLPPPTEQWTQLPLDAPFLVKEVWKEYMPTMGPIRPSPYKTTIRVFNNASDILDKLIVNSRQHETTITGLFHSLALVSFASRLNEAVAPGFEAGTPVNIRRILPPDHPSYPGLVPERIIGNYVSMIYHKYDPDLVARVRSELGRKATYTRDFDTWPHRPKNGARNEPVGLMKFIGDWRAEMNGKLTKPRQFSWSVSNMGVIDGESPSEETPDNWSIRRAQLGVSAEVPGWAMSFAIMSVTGKQMNVSCSWLDCAVELSLAECIVADLENWLVQLGS
ncbi:hypothetical protein GGR54DRAFT_629131 [Hypoxylon sp. NC1633]|nr:hypothetical protein GGR54DRAFT_629131 [Hypoxylon sp. NC1633]